MKDARPKGGSDSEDKAVHGYLVEVTPGRELLYRTPWAFREAMRIGQITAESRIFHRASSRWISITEHPEYRKFVSERAAFIPPVIKSDPAGPSAARPAPPADTPQAPAAPTPPISQKAAEIYQRMTSGLTELKRRLETAKPKRSASAARPVAAKPVASRETSKPAKPRASAKASAPTSSNAVVKPPPSSTAPAGDEEESGQGPQSPPGQSGPRDRWTFYP
jgi:hypothetical protein